MTNLIKNLEQKKLINPPRWLADNVQYLCITGSVAYGTAVEYSDFDIYGFCIPPKDFIFPHLAGEIDGFGTKRERFGEWIQHHIKDEDAQGGKGREYDFTVFNIVKYFDLCMDNNPNMIDTLFVPTNCVLDITAVGQMLRDNRRLFLHRGAYHKFKGYAYSQLHKMSSKNPTGKRLEIREKYGYDVKFAMHLVRLLDECEQILTLGDLDLQRAKEHLKAIRRGEMTEEQIREWFTMKEKALEEMYQNSKLPYTPEEKKIKALLLQCLEHHYGSLEKCVVEESIIVDTLKDIKNKIDSIYHLF